MHPLFRVLVSAAALSAIAAPAAEPDLSYPELVVAPRASERLEAEAGREAGERWTHLAIEAPAAVTAASGIALLIDGTKKNGESWPKAGPWIGIGVGAAWIAYAELALGGETPYSRGAKEVSAMPGKSMREQLVRERRAEEILDQAARTARRARWLAAFTSFGAGVVLVNAAQDGSTAKTFGAITMASALIPVFFSHPWERVAETQHDYKRRIYGPVVGAGLLESGRTVSPGLLLSARF
jgi:hypothetical protein